MEEFDFFHQFVLCKSVHGFRQGQENEKVVGIDEVLKENRDRLKGNCKECFGLCCTALYFSVKDGFPENKNAGKPCKNMKEDFRCNIHEKLMQSGMRGCVAYDCFGAGQQVSQGTFRGQNWRQNPESSSQMFSVFLNMRQLYEIFWYLLDAYQISNSSSIRLEVEEMWKQIQKIVYLLPEELLLQDMEYQWKEAGDLLKRISLLVRGKEQEMLRLPFKYANTFGNRADLSGKDLKKVELKHANLRGAFLIAADLREQNLYLTDVFGADFRDADLRGTDLRNSIYLTQAQINGAHGNTNTKLPKWLDYPLNWNLKMM